MCSVYPLHWFFFEAVVFVWNDIWNNTKRHHMSPARFYEAVGDQIWLNICNISEEKWSNKTHLVYFYIFSKTCTLGVDLVALVSYLWPAWPYINLWDDGITCFSFFHNQPDCKIAVFSGARPNMMNIGKCIRVGLASCPTLGLSASCLSLSAASGDKCLGVAAVNYRPPAPSSQPHNKH